MLWRIEVSDICVLFLHVWNTLGSLKIDWETWAPILWPTKYMDKRSLRFFIAQQCYYVFISFISERTSWKEVYLWQEDCISFIIGTCLTSLIKYCSAFLMYIFIDYPSSVFLPCFVWCITWFFFHPSTKHF